MLLARLGVNLCPYPILFLTGLIVGTCSLANAEQIEIHLINGSVVSGEVISKDSDKLVIKSSSVGKSGKVMTATLSYRRSDIADVVKLADPEDQYLVKMAAAKTAAEHEALALWCRENHLNDQAVEQAKRAVELDPTQEVASKMLIDLDLALIDGKWVKESTALAAQGKVRYEGKVMTLAEAEALKVTAQQQAVIADAQKAADEKAKSLAYIERQISLLEKRPAVIEAELQKANSDLAKAQGLSQKVTEAESSLDAAQKSLDNSRTADVNNGRVGGRNNGGNLRSFTQAVENAQKALLAAKREAASAETWSAQATRKINSLNDEKEAVDKKLADLAAKREALKAK